MQDLKDVTRESHYENYRARCIQSMTRMVIQERKRRLAEGTETGTGRPALARVFTAFSCSCCPLLAFG